MQQEQLFLENWRGGLRHTVNALGGPAVVGKRLWPTKSISYCETKVSNCLNADHDWKFDIEEIELIMRWGRDEGIHVAMHQLCESLDYQKPDIKAPKSRRQLLAEKKLKLAQMEKDLADEQAAIERAEAEEASKLRSVR